MTDVHAYPLESGGHRGDRRCPCGPKAFGNLLEPSRQVWVHRAPETHYGLRTVHDPPIPKPRRRTP